MYSLTNSSYPSTDRTSIYKDSIGISDIFKSFDNLFDSVQPNSKFPPHNIEKVNDTEFVLSLAVAGFTKDEIKITHLRNEKKLNIKGEKPKQEIEKNYTHKGIASRDFSQTFLLADDVVVREVELKDGMLTIELERVIPEEKKPLEIEIK